MTKKFVVWTALITVAVLFLIFFSFSWTLNRQDLVVRGLAKPFFPYFKYSQDELNKMYPQYVNADVATTQSPEETHKLFVSKLKAGDLNGAVECCFVVGGQKDMKESLEQIQKDGLLSKMVSDLDTTIKRISLDESRAAYSYSVLKNGENFGHRINFIKNSKGVWLIESL